MKHNIRNRTAACSMTLMLLTGISSMPVTAQAAELSAPVFSQESGFYDEAFNLELTAPDGCLIYYTLDGSDPGTDSLCYQAPVPVFDRTPEANVIASIASSYIPPEQPVEKAMIVRAAACDADGNLSETVTKTYFIGYDQNQDMQQMPVISLVTDPDNLFDDETGIYTNQGVFHKWTEGGSAWERPANITVFENGQACYTADIGIGIHGNSSCLFPQKSFKLYSRKEYGTKKFDYDFFHGAAKNAAGESILSFNHLILRNGGNDNDLKLCDRLNQEMAAGRSFGTQEMTESIVFIDGEYWGLYNITEKLNESYVAAHYGVKKDSVCLIKDPPDYLDQNTKGREDFLDLVALGESGLWGADAYERAAAVIDMKSFAEYMAAELIIANFDFNNNNYALWKTDTVDSSNPYADGKWRFVMFDTEMIALTAEHDMIDWTKESGDWHFHLLYSLIASSPRFRSEFTEAYYTLCDENYNAERVLKRLDELWQVYQAPLEKTYDRFVNSAYVENYNADTAREALKKEYEQLRTYWENRADYAKAHLENYLDSFKPSGDINDDGLTDETDAELLRDWLLSKPDAEPEVWTDGDMNKNGRLDAEDLTLLKRMLLSRNLI